MKKILTKTIHDECGGAVDCEKFEQYDWCPTCQRVVWLFECDGNTKAMEEIAKAMMCPHCDGTGRLTVEVRRID